MTSQRSMLIPRGTPEFDRLLSWFYVLVLLYLFYTFLVMSLAVRLKIGNNLYFMVAVYSFHIVTLAWFIYYVLPRRLVLIRSYLKTRWRLLGDGPLSLLYSLCLSVFLVLLYVWANFFVPSTAPSNLVSNLENWKIKDVIMPYIGLLLLMLCMLWSACSIVLYARNRKRLSMNRINPQTQRPVL